MIFFDIKGTIIHIFEINQFSANHNEFEIFKRREIVVQTEDDIYTLTFNDKKIELLDNCQVGTEIKAEGKIRGHIWEKNENTFSKNEMRCFKLKIISAEVEINYQGKLYKLHRYYFNGNLMLKLVSTSDGVEIDFSAVSADENDKYENILFSDQYDIEILHMLIKNNILEHLYGVQQYEAASGHVCKVLVMDRFNNNILCK